MANFYRGARTCFLGKLVIFSNNEANKHCWMKNLAFEWANLQLWESHYLFEKVWEKTMDSIAIQFKLLLLTKHLAKSNYNFFKLLFRPQYVTVWVNKTQCFASFTFAYWVQVERELAETFLDDHVPSADSHRWKHVCGGLNLCTESQWHCQGENKSFFNTFNNFQLIYFPRPWKMWVSLEL